MKIVGKPGEAIIDRWTFVHLAFWFVIGADMQALGMPHLWRWPLLMIGALAWEVFEATLQAVAPSMVSTHEGPWNRWVSDPLAAFIGGGGGMLLMVGYGE